MDRPSLPMDFPDLSALLDQMLFPMLEREVLRQGVLSPGLVKILQIRPRVVMQPIINSPHSELPVTAMINLSVPLLVHTKFGQVVMWELPRR